MKHRILKKDSAVRGDKEVQVEVSVFIFEEDEQWIAYCPVLELSSYGDDEKEARKAFDDAVEIFIEETSQHGKLEKALLKLGWGLRQLPYPHYAPPAYNEAVLFKRNPINVYNERVALPIY